MDLEKRATVTMKMVVVFVVVVSFSPCIYVLSFPTQPTQSSMTLWMREVCRH